jgi:ATP-dependent DNA helicase DinG
VDDHGGALDAGRVRKLLERAVTELGGSERPGQVQMAEAVAGAIGSGEHLLVQAGTGTGKSLAYLVPGLLHAEYSGEPVVVATATLALQAQLVDRDLPQLAAAISPEFGRPLQWATLKGRANYACLHRVRAGVPDDQGELVSADEVVSGPVGREVVRAREWAEDQARSDGTGDRDRLEPGVSDRAWAQVSVSSRECLGAQKCPFGTECFAERARGRAVDADVVVTNHALLAIDALDGVPVLPEHEVVVIDEGHELVARVTSVASAELWPGVVELAGKRSRSYVEDGDSAELTDAGDLLRRALGSAPVGRLDPPLPEELLAAVMAVRDAGRTVQSGYNATAKADREPDAEAGRRAGKALVDELFATAERVIAGSEHDVVWTEERERGARVLKVAPLSVSGLLREQLFAVNTVIATSATLELGGSFDPLAAQLGLAGERELEWRGLNVGSPFDYGKQAILYVARGLPKPGRDGLRPESVDALVDLVTAAGGRTLGLFSSRSAAIEAAEAVRSRLDGIPVLCQGEDVVPTLVRKFASDDRTCLFGTLSLWQGVDVPGGSCQLVVIEKLPFPRPDDPLSSARQRAVERSGGNGFMSVAATHAALLLAQGAGRLVRRSSDRGVVAVLDPRLVTARYGSYLRASLPPMWFTTDRDVVIGALRRLAGS